MSDLVERAVEAAARADYASWATESWDDLNDGARDALRRAFRPTVLVALGVVADHCDTLTRGEASVMRHEGPITADDERAYGACEALSSVAAELRETPE